jgi:protein-disulfide isomerase
MSTPDVVKTGRDVLVTIALAAATLSGWVLIYRNEKALSQPAPQSARPALQSDARPQSIIPIDQVVEVTVLRQTSFLGRTEAKKALLEFSDFQCPFCGQYARDIHPALSRRFIDTGQYRFYFVNTPLTRIHPLAKGAAAAGACAGRQGRFWPAYDLLFAQQPRLGDTLYSQLAVDLHLDKAAFESCVLEGAHSELMSDAELVSSLDIQSTPQFMVGDVRPDGSIKVYRKIIGAQPLDSFVATLQ